MSSEELHIPSFPPLRSVGFIQRLVSYEGQLQVVLDHPLLDPDSFPLFVWILQYGKPVPFQVTNHQVHTESEHRIYLEDVDSQESAQVFKNSSILVEIEQFPLYFESRASYDYLIGYQVIDAIHGILGHVLDVVINENGHDNLIVEHKEIEIIIPFVNAIIQAIEEDNQKIFVKLPDGLLELYLE
jgi:16S rRNA processing protein RimM